MNLSFYRKHSDKFTLVADAAGNFFTKYILDKIFRFRQNTKCIVIQSVDDWNKHGDEILQSFKVSGVAGIDCEWVTTNSGSNPISLLQLADSKGLCVLFRLSRIPIGLIPVGLGELLKDKDIIKVGVDVYDNGIKLFNDYCLQVRSILDLRHLFKHLPELQGKSLGLKSLAKEILNYDLNQSNSSRCSNWDSENLTSHQIKYAADDAVLAATLFENVKARKSKWLSYQFCFEKYIEVYLDVPFIQTGNDNSDNENFSKEISNVKQVGKYKNRCSKPRQRSVYENCQLIAPNGEILCSCSKRKAKWYVDKGLGEIVCEEPFVVRLNFEPSGRPRLDNIFYTKEKVNCCAVCGKTENCHRKLVVPSEYRKYFPDLMKKNLSHDVLLLCVDCHKRSNILDQTMRFKLAELCSAPLGCGKNGKYKFDVDSARIRSATSILIYSSDKIPDARKRILEQRIMNYFAVDTLTEETLNEAYNLYSSEFKDSFLPHGLKVYQYFCKNGGLIQFEKMWRQHFLDSMQPKYLPAMWSVEHNHKRLALQVINQERCINFDTSILGFESDFLKVENFQE